jgi:hypothetical protein
MATAPPCAVSRAGARELPRRPAAPAKGARLASRLSSAIRWPAGTTLTSPMTISAPCGWRLVRQYARADRGPGASPESGPAGGLSWRRRAVPERMIVKGLRLTAAPARGARAAAWVQLRHRLWPALLLAALPALLARGQLPGDGPTRPARRGLREVPRQPGRLPATTGGPATSPGLLPWTGWTGCSSARPAVRSPVPVPRSPASAPTAAGPEAGGVAVAVATLSTRCAGQCPGAASRREVSRLGGGG